MPGCAGPVVPTDEGERPRAHGIGDACGEALAARRSRGRPTPAGETPGEDTASLARLPRWAPPPTAGSKLPASRPSTARTRPRWGGFPAGRRPRRPAPMRSLPPSTARTRRGQKGSRPGSPAPIVVPGGPLPGTSGSSLEAGRAEENDRRIPSSIRAVLGRSGAPLRADLRQWAEEGLGVDLRAVRLHTDQEASATAQQIRALAYTIGNHVVVRSDYYSPDGARGRQLLAHELAHVASPPAGALIARQRDPQQERAEQERETGAGSRGPSRPEDATDPFDDLAWPGYGWWLVSGYPGFPTRPIVEQARAALVRHRPLLAGAIDTAEVGEYVAAHPPPTATGHSRALQAMSSAGSCPSGSGDPTPRRGSPPAGRPASASTSS